MRSTLVSTALAHLLFAGLALLLFASVSTSRQSDDDVHRLLKDASVALVEAGSNRSTDPQSLTVRWVALADASATIEKLLRTFPNSPITKDLSLGKTVEGVSIPEVQTGLQDLSAQIRDSQQCMVQLLLSEARKVNDSGWQMMAIQTLGEITRNGPLLDEALVLAESIHGHFDAADAHDSSLERFAEAAARAGFPEKALAALELLDRPHLLAVKMCRVAVAQADTGQPDEAMRTLAKAMKVKSQTQDLQGASFGVQASVARIAIAKALVREGRQDEALPILDSVTDPQLREGALAGIALSQTEFGKVSPETDAFLEHRSAGGNWPEALLRLRLSLPEKSSEGASLEQDIARINALFEIFRSLPSWKAAN